MSRPPTTRGFWSHILPPKVTPSALSFTRTWALGPALVAACLFLCLSGLLLALAYVPHIDHAYASVIDIQYAHTGGSILRAFHRWCAYLALLLATLHLLRIWLTDAMLGRVVLWCQGLALFGVLILSAYTGYLLPWDHDAYWAATIANHTFDAIPGVGPWVKGFLLGTQSQNAPIPRLFVFHTLLLPAALLLLLAAHLYHLRRPRNAPHSPQPILKSTPHLSTRLAAIALALLTLLTLIAAHFPAPLSPPPHLSAPNDPEKAPWFFLWLQEAVAYHTTVGGLILPLALALTLLALPVIRAPNGLLPWPQRTSWRVASLCLSATLFAMMVALHQHMPPPPELAALLNPAVGILLLTTLQVAFFLRRRAPDHARDALFIAFAVTILGLSLAAAARGSHWLLIHTP